MSPNKKRTQLYNRSCGSHVHPVGLWLCGLGLIMGVGDVG